MTERYLGGRSDRDRTCVLLGVNEALYRLATDLKVRDNSVELLASCESSRRYTT